MKYRGARNVSRTIEYDIKHGVTKDEIISFLVTVKTESSFSELRMIDGFDEIIYQLEASLRSIEMQPKVASFSNNYEY